MGREPFSITNPKGNNRDLIIEAVGQSGLKIRLAFLKPGDSFRSEKEDITVRAVRRPMTLEFMLEDGVFKQKEVANTACTS